jgi:ankyrin repeat protein
MRNLKDIVELLLREKININATTERGDTPLHVACLNGFEDIAKLLVEANADVNLADNHETTPLMHGK